MTRIDPLLTLLGATLVCAPALLFAYDKFAPAAETGDPLTASLLFGAAGALALAIRKRRSMVSAILTAVTALALVGGQVVGIALLVAETV